MGAPRRAEIEERDRQDPLAPLRRRFRLPPGLIYLDGNSLGPLPRDTPRRLARVIEQEWGEDLVGAWNRHGWIDLPARVGAKIARLIGARAQEVVVADSISVNLFKLLAAALRLRPGRRVLLCEEEAFPSDRYVADGLMELLGDGYELRCAASGELPAAVCEHTAVVLLSHVHFNSGALHDLRAMTATVGERGALAVWDLAHSAGTMPLELTAAGVELAVGCGYKFLNGGPGAPAFLYVARHLQEQVRQPLQGWMGHAEPFAFEASYRPAPGIRRFLCGTPPILSLAALEAGCDLLLETDLAAVRRKAQALGDLFLELVVERCAAHGFEIACPRSSAQRGSQVCLRHPHGLAIVQALISRGVIGDFRAPDVLRFGFSPLFLRFRDVDDAVAALAAVMEEETWRDPVFARPATVT